MQSLALRKQFDSENKCISKNNSEVTFVSCVSVICVRNTEFLEQNTKMQIKRNTLVS